MTSDYDDLDELLRQNLELRRKLGTEASRVTGMVSAQQSSRRLRSSIVGGVETASDKNELEGLRRELRLRRGFGAEVASGANLSGGSPLASEGTAETASDDEDLNVLRQNLRLRREMAAQVTKVKDGSIEQNVGIAYGSGWILYWCCLAMACVSAFLILRLTGEWHFSGATLIAASVSAFVLYGLGRDLLYVLSGK